MSLREMLGSYELVEDDGVEGLLAVDPVVIEPGQRWESFKSAENTIVIVEPAEGDDVWTVRMAVGLELQMTANAIIDSYRLLDG